MSFNDLLADLDATAFRELADDVAATWSRAGQFAVAVAVMLDRVERPSSRHGMAVFDHADVARLSAAEVEAVRPGQQPQAGDVLTVNGAPHVVHGEAWRDEEMNGRDWLCAIA